MIMPSLRPLAGGLRPRFGALALSAATLLSVGCGPKDAPTPTNDTPNAATAASAAAGPAAFTATLPEIPGVQAIYTLRHPRLIVADLEHLIAAVPQAGILHMGFGALAGLGYPEFTELAADANLGVVLLELDATNLDALEPVFVGFAKLAPEGPIRSALVEGGLVLETRGEWTLIAQDAAHLAKIPAGDAITAHLSRPQTEEVRAWGRATPALLTALEARLMPMLEERLATQDAADRQASIAYSRVLWGYLAQLHSAGGGVDFHAEGLNLSYSAQFLPDSALGKWLRYAPGPDPVIARSIPADALFNLVLRQNPAGQVEVFGDLLDALIAVDHPKGSAALKSMKASMLDFIGRSDGSGVINVNVGLPEPGGQPSFDVFGVYPGTYDAAKLTAYYRDNAEFNDQLANAIFTGMSVMMPDMPANSLSSKLDENAFTAEGVTFGALTSKTTVGENEPVVSVQYFGVVNGAYVFASEEATVRAKLPALRAARPVDNAFPLAFTGDQIALGAIRGERVVDLALGALDLPTNDATLTEELTALKAGFATASAPRVALSAAQAQGELTLSIPYDFVAQVIRLVEFTQAASARDAGDGADVPVDTVE